MSKLNSSANQAQAVGLLLALAIVLLAAAAGIAAVLLVIFPAAALLIGAARPDWVFITPVLGAMDPVHSLLSICAGVLVAALLTRLALWLSRRKAMVQLLGTRR